MTSVKQNAQSPAGSIWSVYVGMVLLTVISQSLLLAAALVMVFSDYAQWLFVVVFISYGVLHGLDLMLRKIRLQRGIQKDASGAFLVILLASMGLITMALLITMGGDANVSLGIFQDIGRDLSR